MPPSTNLSGKVIIHGVLDRVLRKACLSPGGKLALEQYSKPTYHIIKARSEQDKTIFK